MTDRKKPKPGKRQKKVEILQLNRETIQDLTEDEADAAQGGVQLPPPRTARTACFSCAKVTDCCLMTADIPCIIAR